MKSLPNLTFLRSFEAAARHLSFTSAAEELNCTQAAVSNHVRSLEDYLGRSLFVRHARSLTLTDVGHGYLPSVQRALHEIDTATRSLLAQNAKKEVMISCPVSLTEHWMPHVIAGFHQAHPEVQITLNSTVWADLEGSASDITITIGHEEDVSDTDVRLWDERLLLLASPEVPPLVDARQLLEQRVIQIIGRPEYWQQVCASLGLDHKSLKTGFQCNSTIAALELASAGAGYVAAPKSLAMKLLERGDLIEPIQIDCPSPWTYYANFGAGQMTPAALLFKDWLLGAADAFKL